jgi:hypothetical protein
LESSVRKASTTYQQDTPKNFRLRREFAMRKLRNYMPMAVSFLSTGSMNLIVSLWVGWQSVPENLHSVSEWRRIETVYDKGRNSYVEYVKDEDA